MTTARLLTGSVALTLLYATAARAEVSLHHLFSDHGVLQRDKPLPVWGTARAGESVTVTLGSQTQATTANAAGEWSVALPGQPAGGPYELVVQGENRVVVRDVLLGEVWLASGQSNMNMLMRPNLPWSGGVLDYEKEIAAADFSKMRFFDVPTTFAETPARDVGGHWTVCTPAAAAEFSAAAYYFARDVHRELNVPVGVIVSSVGATAIGAWTSRERLEKDPSSSHAVAAYDARVHAFLKRPPTLPPADANAAKDLAKDAPKDPRKSIGAPFLLYNGMIAPLMPYACQGAIWYQGEGNSRLADTYTASMQAMVDDWRSRWGQGDFPFYYVQLTAHGPQLPEPSDHNWAHLREAQTHALKIPNTGMAVTIDVGAADTSHPRDKRTVGHRLALLALAKTYGLNVRCTGPMLESMKISGDSVRLRFDVGADVLQAAGGKPQGFAIAGDDRKFAWADATVDGSDVIVTSRAVAKPVAVRYAWAENPVATLSNSEGLPAVRFVRMTGRRWLLRQRPNDLSLPTAFIQPTCERSCRVDHLGVRRVA